MKSPFFSVIIPTFNRANKLPKSLNSVINQTFADFEVIIIDNGSTDNTEKKILDEFDDSRIRYFWQEGSGSPANPRNQGIIKSRGVWISFLDSDDKWYPEKLESVYDKIQVSSNADVICHDERMVNTTYQKTKHISHSRKSNDMYKSMLLDGNFLSPSATSIRKSFLSKNELFFNESSDFAIVEDYDLWLHLAKNGAVITFIKRTLSDYVVDGGNMISDLHRYINNLGNLYKHHAYYVQEFEPKIDRLYDVLKAKILYLKLQQDLERKNYFKVFIQFIKILRTSITFFPRAALSKALNSFV